MKSLKRSLKHAIIHTIRWGFERFHMRMIILPETWAALIMDDSSDPWLCLAESDTSVGVLNNIYCQAFERMRFDTTGETRLREAIQDTSSSYSVEMALAIDKAWIQFETDDEGPEAPLGVS